MSVLRWVMEFGLVDVFEDENLEEAVANESWNDGTHHKLICYEDTETKKLINPLDPQVLEIDQELRESKKEAYRVTTPPIAHIEILSPSNRELCGSVLARWTTVSDVHADTPLADVNRMTREWMGKLGSHRVRIKPVRS